MKTPTQSSAMKTAPAAPRRPVSKIPSRPLHAEDFVTPTRSPRTLAPPKLRKARRACAPIALVIDLVGSDEETEPEDEPMGSCVDCGARISAHAQWCGKWGCDSAPLESEEPEPEDQNTNGYFVEFASGTRIQEGQDWFKPEPEPLKPATGNSDGVDRFPVMQWKPRQFNYPHSLSGEPLHDLAAAMLRITREAAMRIYESSNSME